MTHRSLRLSLCMIVKDEADRLRRCLEGLIPIVDEIILVDTGSQDQTPAIARELGAKIFSFPWTGNFAAARNFSLEQARSQWILVLDADEELPPATQALLPALVNAPPSSAYVFPIWSYLQESPGASCLSSPSPRLFPNHPDFRYQGALHESLTIPPHFPVLPLPHPILHYGYLKARVMAKEKITRNLKILRSLLRQRINPHLTHFYIGAEYYRLGDLRRACRHFLRSYRCFRSQEHFTPYLFQRLAFLLWSLGEREQARQYLEEGLSLYPDYTDLYLLQGRFHHETGEYAAALHSFHRCLELGEPSLAYVTVKGVGTYLPHFFLGLVHEDMNHLEAAREHYRQALELQPQYTPALHHLLRLLVKLDSRESAWSYLQAHFAWEEEATCQALIQAWVQLRLNQAHSLLEAGIQGLGGAPALEQAKQRIIDTL